jgi:hypothetical protein
MEQDMPRTFRVAQQERLDAIAEMLQQMQQDARAYMESGVVDQCVDLDSIMILEYSIKAINSQLYNAVRTFECTATRFKEYRNYRKQSIDLDRRLSEAVGFYRGLCDKYEERIHELLGEKEDARA